MELAVGVQSQGIGACAPYLLVSVLLVSFSDTLLMFLILGIVYDCHLIVPGGTMAPF